MAYVAVGTFASNNLAIQGESIQLSFPIATDKNQDTVSYSLQYATQPIYCNAVGGSYICIENTDSITLSSWENLGPLTGDSTITITRNIPLFSTDVVLKYYIRATDNQLGGGTEPIIESGNIFLIRNTFVTLQMSTIDWTAEENILVNGIISNLGTTRPANYTSIANTGAWLDWRAGIVAALGSTITFTYYYSYSLDNISYSTPALVGSSFDLSYDWLQDRNVALTIDNTEGPPVFSSGNSYYLKIYLVSSLYPEYSSSTLPQLLLNRMPVLNIKKGLLKINMPQKDLGKTGAVMASHGPQQINGAPGEGDSMALYDHHVEVGASEPTNEPSIGFYTTTHAKLAELRAKKVGVTDTLVAKIANYFYRLDLSTTIITLVPGEWVSKKYTISNPLITSNSDIHLGLSNPTDAQAKEWAKASIVCESQSTGQFILRAVGPAPTINIPIVYTVGGRI